jgi:hypothetical protein
MSGMTEQEIEELYEDWGIRSQAVAYLKLRREYDAQITSAWAIYQAHKAVELDGRSGRDAVLFHLAEQTEAMRQALAELDDPFEVNRSEPYPDHATPD